MNGEPDLKAVKFILKKRWGYFAVFGALFGLAALIGWFLFRPDSSAAEELSKEEAKKLVENRYGGSVSSMQEEKQIYYAKMEIQGHFYEVKVDGKTGKILAIEWIEKLPEDSPSRSLSEEEIKKIILAKAPGELVSFEKATADGKPAYKGVVKDADQNTSTIIVNAETGAVLSEDTKPANPPRRITEHEAASIAQKEVQGEVDDIDLETENGQTFYLVEIQTVDDREATVQVHAITGAVMSVLWDE
ncbi:peptidase propeptide and ypeb domain-containing protein [Bacillus sp. B-jedd]|nr:peptidase propeptide and ypeb domain-containing protein [Bacillus sp. B-jedd]